MQIKHRYYPYPIVCKDDDSYIDTEFISDANMSRDGYNLKFTFSASINNDEINELVKEKKIFFVHHIECTQTCYRNIVQTDDNMVTFTEHESKLNGLVQICTFLVAAEDISQYKNEKFSTDYRGFSFNIEKGCILGIGNQINIHVNKEKDDLEHTESIFLVVPILDPNERMLYIDTNDKSKIIVRIPDKSYNMYRNLGVNLELQPVIHSMIIVPALMYVFEELKKNVLDLYIYEDYRWFRSLKKVCKKFDIDLTEGGLMALDSYQTAQLLMDSPAIKALKFLAECNGGGDE